MEIPHVDTWDLSLYPERDGGGNAASDRYRFEVYDKNGLLQHHKTPIFEEKLIDSPGGQTIARVKVGEKNLQPKMWDVTGAGNDEDRNPVAYRYGIPPIDVREAEKRIAGKPTHVQMGLWFRPLFSEDATEILEWKPVNRKEELQPPYWRNMDMAYYGKDGWREQAYKGHPDPYKNQERPITRMMEMEAEMMEKEKELVAARFELERKINLANKP